MSKVEELIKEICPKGVKYKTISDVCHIIAGGDAPKNHMSNEKTKQYNVPIYSNGIGNNALYGYTDEAKIFDKAVTISARGTIGWVALRTVPFYPIVRLICAYPKNKEELSAEYLYFLIQTLTFHVPDGGIPQLTVPMIGKKEIPIPPMKIQKEIVYILDKFTELEAKLQDELDARKKQYEYYRDELLSFDDTVDTYKMGEVLSFLNGRAYKQEELLNDGKYPVLRVGNFYTNDSWYYSDLELDDNKYCEKGDLLYSWAATLGPKIWDGNKCIYHYHIWKIVFDDTRIDKEYLYYYLQYDLSNIARSTTNSTMIHVSMGSMKERMISIPPIEKQKQIVSILNKFEVLCKDAKQGLSAEIEARRKQYEYYRDKLLSFERFGE